MLLNERKIMSIKQMQEKILFETARNATHINYEPSNLGWCEILEVSAGDGAKRHKEIVVKTKNGQRTAFVISMMIYEKTFFEKRSAVELPSVDHPLKTLHTELTAACTAFQDKLTKYAAVGGYNFRDLIENVCIIFSNARHDSYIESLTNMVSVQYVVAYYRGCGLSPSTAVALVGIELTFEMSRLHGTPDGVEWMRNLFQMLSLILPELEKAITPQQDV